MSKITSITELSADEVKFDEVKDWYTNHLSPDVIDFDDPKPYEVYSQARWGGIFQLSSAGSQRLFVKAKPKNIVDIATLTSIYRPGPLAANVDKLYLDACNGKEMDWGDHRINDILAPTKSCLTGDSNVVTEEGEITIQKIVEDNLVGLKIPSFNEETGEIEQDEIVAAISNGIKDIIELEMEDGTKLKLTYDHLVMTQRDWVEAGKLTLDDEIYAIADYIYLSGAMLKDEQEIREDMSNL